MANYEFWYCDESGNRISYIDNVGAFEYVHTVGDVGVLIVNLPRIGDVYEQTARDNRIHVYRQPIGGALALEFVAFLNTFNYTTTTAGAEQLRLDGDSPNGLIARRIAADYSGDATTTITDAADDMMKTIITNNMISNIDYSGTPSPTRSLSGIGLSVQSDLGDGPSISKGFAWQNLLRVIQDLQAASKTAGNEVFFGIVPTTATALEFQARTGQWGNDRTQSGVNPVVFSLERGNLINPSLTYSYAGEGNKVYAGGKGETSSRIVQTAQDNTRIGASVGGLREHFSYSQGSTTATVSDDADDELSRLRPKPILTGEITDHPTTRYGLDWKVGDKVTVSYTGFQFDVMTRSVRVKVDMNGLETITSRIEDVS